MIFWWSCVVKYDYYVVFKDTYRHILIIKFMIILYHIDPNVHSYVVNQ
jgi:hypothetical protein